ncbi:MAG: sensor histidine kinase, partial [Gammaproteobacteria bacterium]|nr:sensor histidine kinase [Gammaproteobacteria bacterium]MBL6999667.1 sensor histidine kinase [Gammaproteobacteria bacterium]
MPPLLRRNLLILSATLLLLIPLIWVTHYISWNNGFDQLHTSNQQQLEQFVEHLDSRLARFKFLPQLIAKNQLLVELLNDPKNTPRVDLVNHFLEEINTIIGASDTYLMDSQGLTLAASNWRSKRPFIGSNFSFRPYFVNAMQGKLGQYFALGTTSGERGYYFAYPIRYAATTIGVIVTKMDLSNIEQRWSSREVQFIVTDPDGIIFITTQPDWLYRSTRTLSQETLLQIAL